MEKWNDARWLGPVATLLGEAPGDPGLYETALTHPSRNGMRNYQRLEFLGDTVLSTVVSHLLYRDDDAATEGALTRKRTAIVRQATQASVARRLGLDDLVLLDRSEEQDDGRAKDSILSDVFESFIGAMYLDKGYGFAFGWIERCGILDEPLQTLADSKSALLELAQSRKLGQPRYAVSRVDGVPPRETFHVEVMIGELRAGDGSGSSRKQAEQDAARKALVALGSDDRP